MSKRRRLLLQGRYMMGSSANFFFVQHVCSIDGILCAQLCSNCSSVHTQMVSQWVDTKDLQKFFWRMQMWFKSISTWPLLCLSEWRALLALPLQSCSMNMPPRAPRLNDGMFHKLKLLLFFYEHVPLTTHSKALPLALFRGNTLKKEVIIDFLWALMPLATIAPTMPIHNNSLFEIFRRLVSDTEADGVVWLIVYDAKTLMQPAPQLPRSVTVNMLY